MAVPQHHLPDGTPVFHRIGELLVETDEQRSAADCAAAGFER
jgi:hypothetical protein